MSLINFSLCWNCCNSSKAFSSSILVLLLLCKFLRSWIPAFVNIASAECCNFVMRNWFFYSKFFLLIKYYISNFLVSIFTSLSKSRILYYHSLLDRRLVYNITQKVKKIMFPMLFPNQPQSTQLFLHLPHSITLICRIFAIADLQPCCLIRRLSCRSQKELVMPCPIKNRSPLLFLSVGNFVIQF